AVAHRGLDTLPPVAGHATGCAGGETQRGCTAGDARHSRAASQDTQGASATHGGEQAVWQDCRCSVHASRRGATVGHPVCARDRRYPPLCHRRLHRPLPRIDAERVQLRGVGAAWTHPQVWTGDLASGDAAMRMGQRAQRRRSEAQRDVRTVGAARGQEACDCSGDTPAGGATASSLAGGVGGSSGRGNVSAEFAERSRRVFPNGECLRLAAWSPPRGGTPCSLAALATRYGHGALIRATDYKLVTVLSGTRPNNRLATTLLVSASKNRPQCPDPDDSRQGGQTILATARRTHHDYASAPRRRRQLKETRAGLSTNHAAKTRLPELLDK